jgi:triphosphoribosyl-dephospho-CoA synthase
VAAQLACLLEASAEKPGNVTPSRSFRDMNYGDFLRSAAAIGPEMARASERSVGATILAAVTATRRWTQANTNLGIILLLVPLAKAAFQSKKVQREESQDEMESYPFLAQWPSELTPSTVYTLRAEGPLVAGTGPLLSTELRANASAILHQLTVDDAALTYAAIRLAMPGGLGSNVEHDVHADPTVTLRDAMASAARRDSIAAEYLSDYAITFECGLPALEAVLSRGASIEQAVVQTFLQLLATVPDTLIARKRGRAIAESVAAQAGRVLAAGGIFSPAGQHAIKALDAELRVNGHSLNPGATADLSAATLFVALLIGVLK